MCEIGVLQLVTPDSRKIDDFLAANASSPVRDGFGPGRSVNADVFEMPCPVCGEVVPIARRELVSSNYRLPDLAVYQGLLHQSPCIAAGLVGEHTTTSRDPALHPGLRERWQGLLWRVYQVAYVDLGSDASGAFCPLEAWQHGEPLPDLKQFASDLIEVFSDARRTGRLSHGHSSRAAQHQAPDVMQDLLTDYGFTLSRPKQLPCFWWACTPDIVLERAGQTIAIEVKVDEDWDAPLVQPLGYLIHHNATIELRLPSQSNPLDQHTRSLMTKAEARLEATGRAQFIDIGCG